VLSNADVSLSRIVDMARRFNVGDRVNGAFVGDPRKGTAKYTLVAGQDDPWPSLEKQFPVGKIFSSVVCTVVDKVGPFVTVAEDVNGLIPEKTLTGPVPPAGTPVEVRVAKIDAVNRKISLRLNRQLTAVTDLPTAQPSNTLVGQRGYGKVVKAIPLKDGRGGFILLEISGRERPAMLLCKDMSADLRDDLRDGEIRVGDEIYVEVTRVEINDKVDRVLLRELPDPEDEYGTEDSAKSPAA
jgi:ribosomal protein S1